MALYTKKGNEIPSDAVELTEPEAIEFMKNIVKSWRNSREVFFINYGSGILAGLTALTGAYINNYFRMRVRLQSFGRVSTYLPVVVVPAVTIFMAHTNRVQEPILIDKFACPVCLEVRSISFQLAFGLLYPLLLAPIATFTMAGRHHTYHLPAIEKDPKSVWMLYQKMLRTIRLPLLAITGLHISAAAFIAYKENSNVLTVKHSLVTMEEEVLNKT